MMGLHRVRRRNGSRAKGRRSGWLAGRSAGLAAGAALVWREWAEPLPLFPLDLLRIPIFALSITTSIVSFAAQMLAYVTMPFRLQSVLGRSVFATGLLMTPWPIAVGIAAPFAGRLADRVPAGLLGGIGLAIFAAGLFFLSRLGAIAAQFRDRLAHGPMRPRLRPVPVAQQPDDRQRRAQAAFGRRGRHAGDGAAARPDRRRGDGRRRLPPRSAFGSRPPCSCRRRSPHWSRPGSACCGLRARAAQARRRRTSQSSTKQGWNRRWC